ncbi:alpha/beta fold hydrolase [Pollutimonas nitritireducens]|nr:alpha/beta fold hydrolase [Pollutimonas nitritireducens]
MQVFGSRAYKVGLSVRTIGQGPNLILIHGGAGSRTHWTNNVETLAASFTVVTLDLPGFGESATVSEGISTQEYLAWVAQAVRLAVNDQPFHLAGFSFGGAVSAGVAVQLAAQGHAPSRLSLISPSGFGKPTGRLITLEKVRKSDSTPMHEINAATARNLGRWMLAKEPSVDDPAVEIHLRNVGLARFDSRVISYENSLIKNLQRLDIPLQILLGEQDPLIFPSKFERKALLNQSLPKARVEMIPGAGHWLQYEASSAVNTTISQFHLEGTKHELPNNQHS